ncbi:MAG: metallophosphoesterase family protein, partial [Mycobacteriales bacterium]
SNWSRTYQVSGLLADFKAVPGKLTELYTRDTTSADKVRALLRLEDTLTKASEQKTNQETAYKILFISDMHLRDMYAYVGNVARQQGVKLIINTGDESEYGSTFEMTQRYLQSIRHLTAKVPMIWIAGNHDSPQTVRIMRSIPKVIVLGDKTERADGSYQVTGQEVQAFGLRIAGLADPRVFGAKGVAGASDTTKTNPLEVASVQEAGKTFAPDQTIDIGMGHEPVAADELEMVLRARLMASGHTHEQNDPGDLQDSDYINLNEGSTGLGGLDHYDTSPMEFSVMAVAPDCQFTQITRYQLSDPARPSDSRKAQIRTVTFTPQKVDDGRTCTTDKGISDVADWNGAAGKILTQAAG